MGKRQQPAEPAIEPRVWTSMDEIDRAIAKINKRIKEFEELDVRAAMRDESAADDVAIGNVKEAMREISDPILPNFASTNTLGCGRADQPVLMFNRC